MPVKITIIGLGQIGASMGLALAAHKDKVFRVGHDKDYSVEQRARKLDVVDETKHNLPNAVEDADLIILALPLTQIRDTFRYIAQSLREGAVVMETSPVKAEVAKWAKELLPETVYHVGIVPALAAKHLTLTETGLNSAQADLFQKSIFLVSAPPGTPGEAINLASDYVGLLGASALLTDFVESDGLTSSAELLPQLTSAALLKSTIYKPGWSEMRKTASNAYFTAVSGFSYAAPESLALSASHSRESVIRALNSLIDSLLDLRESLENKDDESLRNQLISAHRARLDWLEERDKADWTRLPVEKVEKPSFMESLFGSKLGRVGKPKDQ